MNENSGRRFSFGSRSGVGTEPISEQMQDLFPSEIIHGILEHTHVIISTVNVGVLEILDERLGTFWAKVMAIVGARTLSFGEFCTCGSPVCFGDKDPIASRRWLADIANAFWTSFCLGV